MPKGSCQLPRARRQMIRAACQRPRATCKRPSAACQTVRARCELPRGLCHRPRARSSPSCLLSTLNPQPGRNRPNHRPVRAVSRPMRRFCPPCFPDSFFASSSLELIPTVSRFLHQHSTVMVSPAEPSRSGGPSPSQRSLNTPVALWIVVVSLTTTGFAAGEGCR